MVVKVKIGCRLKKISHCFFVQSKKQAIPGMAGEIPLED